MMISKPRCASKPEKYLEIFFEKIVPSLECYRNHRAKWLTNPQTNHFLEIDFYFPEIKVGIEYQGYQHFRQGKYKQDLDYQQYKDMIKQEISWKNRKVKILEIFEPDLRKLQELDEWQALGWFIHLLGIRLKRKHFLEFRKKIRNGKYYKGLHTKLFGKKLNQKEVKVIKEQKFLVNELDILYQYHILGSN